MNYSFLSKVVLFKGISENELKAMLKCLGITSKKYKKGETIYHAGDIICDMGLVLSGSVNIENYDVWGNKSILDNIGEGQIFAETYASIPNEPLMVNVVVVEPSEILFLNISKVLKTCSNSCIFHSKLIINLLAISAQKNLNLSRRIFYTSSKSIRGRLLSYFSQQAMLKGNYEFTIPFNRQQLADFLGVDRSAMSNELSKMKSEGILNFEKKMFTLNKEHLTYTDLMH